MDSELIVSGRREMRIQCLIPLFLLGTFFTSPLAASTPAEALRADVESAIAVGRKDLAQAALNILSGSLSAIPADMEDRLASVSRVDAGTEAASATWHGLVSAADQQAQSGHLEGAASTLESALEVANQSFGEDHWFSIMTIRNLGLTYRNMGNGAMADSFYGIAWEAARDSLGPDHIETLGIGSLRAELYAAAGMTNHALELLASVSEGYRNSLGDSHLRTLNSGLDQVAVLELAGNYAKAIRALDQLCKEYAVSLTSYHEASLRCQDYLASLQRNAGSIEEAERIREDMSRIMAASLPVVNEFALANMIQIADIWGEQGEYQVAKDLLSGLILTARQIGLTDLGYTGKAYLSRILGYEGDLSNAVTLSEDIVSYGATAWDDNPLQYYNVSLELGGLYQRQNRFNEAETIFVDAMAELQQVVGDQHPTTLVAMNNLGSLYEQQGLYDEAEPLLKQTLARMEQSLGRSHPQTARTRNNLALLHESQGNFREAEPLYHSSLEQIIAAYGESHPNALAMQNNLAFLYMLMEDYKAAETMFRAVLDTSSEVLGAEHQDTLKTLNNLGRVQQKLNRLDEAEQNILHALNSRINSLGNEHMDSVRSRIDLGSVYIDQSRLDVAHQQLTLALATAEKIAGEQHPYTFEALNLLARLLEERGDLAEAVSLREEGLARRSSFLDRVLWVAGENAREGYMRLHRPELDAYLSLLTRLDDPDAGKKAIDASLQRKGMLLKVTSEIEQIAQLSVDPALTDIAADLEEARRELAALTLSGPTAETKGRHAQTLYELERRVNELQGDLGRASVRFRSSIEGATVEVLADALPDNRSFVDLLNYDDAGKQKLLAGVMNKVDGEVTYELVVFDDRLAIDEAVIAYRRMIQDDLADDDEILEAGQWAYDLLWSFVAEAIGDQAYVYLVPDGVLNILPFNALVDEDDRYLIESTDIHLLTSGRDLLPNRYELAEGELVILAGPDYDSDQVVSADQLAAATGKRSAALKLGIRGAGNGLRGLSFEPLPGAAQEGRIITGQVQRNEQVSEVYFGKEAQEQVLSTITKPPEILHMATHGFFLEADDTLRKRLLKMQRSLEVLVPPPGDNPLLRAGLAFAGVNTNAQFLGDIDTVNDGVLTALEVLGLDLSGTKLVVLSACETGLGEIHEGEGVYGLRRSFQEAGVAEVISSLWEVSDAGTQALMTDFYDRMLKGVPAREALRDTQLKMLDSPEWGYPYIWSAFMIVGSYESAGMTFQ